MLAMTGLRQDAPNITFAREQQRLRRLKVSYCAANFLQQEGDTVRRFVHCTLLDCHLVITAVERGETARKQLVPAGSKLQPL